jgi:1-phosphofructokinase family hexose kinase
MERSLFFRVSPGNTLPGFSFVGWALSPRGHLPAMTFLSTTKRTQTLQTKIITIGLSPAWDRTIEVAGIDWGEHKIVSSQKIVPAGKALNINRSLAQMEIKSIAAGLWGADDWDKMQKAAADLKKFVQLKFIKAIGETRENITVVDTAKKRNIHLRSKNTLADKKSLSDLNRNLKTIITKDSLCVFAGAMPGGKLFPETRTLLETAKRKQAKIIIDSSGGEFKKIVSNGGLFMIKPNVEELSELAGRKIENEKESLADAAKKFLNKTEFILVSRGDKGAMLIGRDLIISTEYCGKKYDVCNTVGCGDYLLAGFIAGLCKTGDLKIALQTAVQSASTRAFGK